MTYVPAPAAVPSRRKRAIVAGLAAVLVLGACTTIDPYTQEEKTSNTAKGAGIGAAAGALAGVIIGGNRKGLLIGAGIGAARRSATTWTSRKPSSGPSWKAPGCAWSAPATTSRW